MAVLTLWLWEGFGENLLAEMIGLALTAIVIDFILLRSNRLKWMGLENKIRGTISHQIESTLTDLVNILDHSAAEFVAEPQDSESVGRKIDAAYLKKLHTLASMDTREFRKKVDPGLFESHYGDLFDHRQRTFNNLELKYHEHLEPQEISLLMDLQELLWSLHMDIFIRNKQLGGVDPINVQLRMITENRIIQTIHALVKRISESARDGVWRENR